MTVSATANQAVANDDFAAYQREANKADIEAKFGKPAEPAVEPKPAAKPASQGTEAPVQERREPAKPRGIGSMSPSELRKLAREQEAELTRLRTQPRVEVIPPEEVPETAPKQAEQLRPRPKVDSKDDKGELKYKTWEQYEDDLLSWNEEKILRSLDERTAKTQREAQIEAFNRTIEQSWNERVRKAREAHADFDEVALAENGPGKLIQKGSIVDEWLMDSEHGAELLYYFGQHPEELRKFENVAGGRAGARRALVKLEDSLVTPAPKPKPEPEEVRITKAPRPSSEVGGRGTQSPDPVNSAVADDDVGRYIREANRREIAQKFGKH